ncbi:hypothetical protein BDF19DRAFT_449464 [Syncephalis fuscata]|nr:hypothetical protein BDF19DRAFT_449464 [Syncephalis fuscata]
MFKFNFALDETNEVIPSQDTSTITNTVAEDIQNLSLNTEQNVRNAEKVDIDCLIPTLPEGILTQVVIASKEQNGEIYPAMKRLSNCQEDMGASSDDIKESKKAQERDWLRVDGSDLINGIYEGGFKTWECAFDLMNYLMNSTRPYPAITTPCECYVDMQDYNVDVLRLTTLPNVLVNTTAPASLEESLAPLEHIIGENPSDAHSEKESESELEDVEEEDGEDDEEKPIMDYNSPDWHPLPLSSARAALAHIIAQRSQFYAGDWSTLSTVVDGLHSYDIILTAETLYHADNHGRLYTAIRNTMRRPNGKAYVAAKTVYFGCTGSTLSFIDYVNSVGELTVARCHQVDSSVKREILCLTWIQ